MVVIPVAIDSLLYLTPSLAKGKFLCSLKPWLAQKVHAKVDSIFLFSSITITQLLSAYLKSKLHLLPVSEMGTFHTLALNFGGWPFRITVTRYLRPKSVHSNERVYREPIDRRLKTLLKEGSGSFLRPITPELSNFF